MTKKEAPRPSSAHQPTCDPDQAAKTELLKNFGDYFQGMGCFQGEFHITVEPAVSPVVHPPRRVPEAPKEALKEEVDSLVEQCIIAKVTEPTDWVNTPCVCHQEHWCVASLPGS